LSRAASVIIMGFILMDKHATLADIAKKSRVSVSTVSLVLRDKPGIPTETRTRVLTAARSLGYTTRRRAGVSGAPRLARKLSTLGLILKADHDTQPRANPFYSHVVAGIEEACRRNHINLLYATMPVNTDNVPVEVPRLLEEDSVDGLLLVGAFVPDALNQLLHAQNAHVVLVDAYAAPNGYDAILSDNVRGAYEAVSYLIERGHRHIGLLGTHPNAYPSLQQRRAAYTRALQDHAIENKYFADSSFDRHDVIRATTTLLQENPQITALFGVNDEVAIAAMNAAQSLGRRIPEELSVIGFDDIDLAQHVMPPLTTMHVDKVGMGRLAVQLLADRIQFPESDRITTLLQPRLVERRSVANAPTHTR
jgi:LacI family transcriptional regulator